jgi:hypothetical protein
VVLQVRLPGRFHVVKWMGTNNSEANTAFISGYANYILKMEAGISSEILVSSYLQGYTAKHYRI